MIERFRNVLIRATVGGLAFSAIAVSGSDGEEARGRLRPEFVKRGTLSCDIAAGIGLVVGSSKALTCVFEADGTKVALKYSGTIDKLGPRYRRNGGEPRRVVGLREAQNQAQGRSCPANYSGLSAEFAAGLGLGRNPWSLEKGNPRCSRGRLTARPD